MILRIKKRDFIFLLTSLLIAIPLIIAGLLITIPTALGAVNKSFFVVELTIGGRDPVVYWVNWTDAGNLVEASTARFEFTFNVSDPDGFNDIDHTKTLINITLGGMAGNAQQNYNQTCDYSTYNTNFTFYNCSVSFNYWNNASSEWVVNVSVEDDSGRTAFNDTMTFTVNSLTAMRIENPAVNWSSGLSVGTNDNAANTNPMIVNNTGNQDFTIINITGSNLTGVTSSSYYIYPGNITVNPTDNADGTRINTTGLSPSVTIADAILTHGKENEGNMSLYFYIDVPTGLLAQVYNVSSQWEMVLDTG